MSNVSCGLLWHSKDKTERGGLRALFIEYLECLCKKKKKKSPFNNTACDCAYNVKKNNNNQMALVNASKLCGPLMMDDV